MIYSSFMISSLIFPCSGGQDLRCDSMLTISYHHKRSVLFHWISAIGALSESCYNMCFAPICVLERLFSTALPVTTGPCIQKRGGVGGDLMVSMDDQLNGFD